MTIADAVLIREAREWVASVAFLESPRSQQFTLRFTIIAGPGPNRLYTLICIEEPETSDSEATVKALPPWANRLRP